MIQESTSPEPALIVHASDGRLTLVALSSLLMGGFGVLMVSGVIDLSGTVLDRVLGVALIGLGVGAMVKLPCQIGRPLLRVDAEGFTYPQLWTSTRRLPWSDVRSVSVVGQRRQESLVVHLLDDRAVMARMTLVRRCLSRGNRLSMGSPIVINLALAEGTADLGSRILAYRPTPTPD